MKPIYLLITFALVVSSDTCKNNQSQESASDFNIIFTGNVNGEIEPCGWKTNPSGGLARKASYLSNMRSEGKNIFVVDSGDLFFQKGVYSDSTRNEMAAKAGLILESFNEMGTTALNVGDDEFMLGISFLLSLKDRANFPFLSSNIQSSEFNKPLFERYIIKKVGDLNIGFIGVAWDGGNFPKSVNIMDPVNSARDILNDIKNEVDLVVALTNMPFKVEQAFADSVDGIDMIIGGHDGKSHLKPKMKNGRGVYKAGADGQNLGLIKVSYKNKRSNLSEISSKLFNLKRVDIKLKRLEEKFRGSTIEETYDINKQDAAKLEELKAKKKYVLQEIDKLDNTASFELITLTNDYPADEKIESFVSEFRVHFPKVEDENDSEELLLDDVIEQ